VGFIPRPVRDDDNIWGEEGDSRMHKAAVDAQYAVQLTWDFFQQVLGRNSYDGKGAPMVAVVNAGGPLPTAVWVGRHGAFGNGGGRQMGPLVSIDVVAHEIAHGLTQKTANLRYRGESGGINESVSDIIGTGVEWFASQQNPNVKFDWMMGEDFYTPSEPGDALRYFDDPKRDNYSVDHYSEFGRVGEVHGTSGIMNNAFYLLSEGGTNRTSGMRVETGIGIEKSLKIFYRALVEYLERDSKFSDARAATIRAAADLFGEGSVEAQRVAEAWTAVGVS
jgi:Zn-dependent metalloprotease